ncbi:MAG TPA: GntR family transcriptional regulator, partial [Tepidisphaeraceae bacterium]|nr:GntR family transcriptional regulator [Tepidisphaeraceae bacterium]
MAIAPNSAFRDGMVDEVPRERMPETVERAPRLSYKFQRLRERLREAIETGVLSGKLPGERVLARQFRVNAKTLSKALTDLAAEGLLERTIGRGTFVKGQTEPTKSKSLGKWLVLASNDRMNDPLLAALETIGAEIQVVTDLSGLRPSFLVGFNAVVDAHGVLPESMLRDLLLRSLRVALVDSTPKTYSASSVLIDRVLCASKLAQSLLRDGHTKIGVIEAGDKGEVFEAVASTIRRLAPEATVEQVKAESVITSYNAGVTGFICENFVTANEAIGALRRNGVEVPKGASVVGMGLELANSKASGYAVKAAEVAEGVRMLLNDAPSHRPTPLWLVGAYVEHGTIGP